MLYYWTRKKHFATQLWWATAWLIVMSWAFQSTKWFFISPCGVRGMRFCGPESGGCSEESWHEIYPGKPTQKCSKDDKEAVCSYHVTYPFSSESTLCRYLNAKEILARNGRDIWSLSDCNGIRIHNHLVCKVTLNHLVKLAKWLNA